MPIASRERNNIALMSYAYAPSIGGTETVSRLLAREFARVGENVMVVTMTAGAETKENGVDIERRPGRRRLFEIVRWSDVVLQSNIHLRNAWPLIFIRRPLVVTTHTWIDNGIVGSCWVRVAKRLVLQSAYNVFISEVTRAESDIRGVTIPNPYDSEVFCRYDGVVRESDIIFVGRLIYSKGVDILLRAVAVLYRQGVKFTVTVVGDGPERMALEDMAGNLGIAGLVSFKGTIAGLRLGRLLAAHKVIAVPSRCVETFGVVVLEGLACGCVVVVANRGGLSEAAGGCGILVNSETPGEWARALVSAISQSKNRGRAVLEKIEKHLNDHRPDRIAKQYLKLIDSVTNRGKCYP